MHRRAERSPGRRHDLLQILDVEREIAKADDVRREMIGGELDQGIGEQAAEALGTQAADQHGDVDPINHICPPG